MIHISLNETGGVYERYIYITTSVFYYI